MTAASRARRSRRLLPTLLCALVLPVCALFVRPFVEMGIVDDWSYIRSAQVLAATGHIVYNGWATAMLGWQLYAGALFIKLFGFSFTAPRAATLFAATLAAALMQRLYVRLGLREWNSAAATLIVVLSPVWMAVSFSFMSDVYGMLVLLACGYCCVRALGSQEEIRILAWVCVAAVSDALGGTARQIAWLGVLVMVPCTLWLLRGHRRVLRLGGLATLVSIALVAASLRWFNHQPFAIPESALPAGPLHVSGLLTGTLPYFVQFNGFELLFLAMPLLLTFAPSIFSSRRTLLASLVVIGYWMFRIVRLQQHGDLHLWEFPYFGNNLDLGGWEIFPSYLGSPPTLITPPVRLTISCLVLLGELALLSLCLERWRPGVTGPGISPLPREALSPYEVAIVLGPCTLAYFMLLLPRFVDSGLLDRYFLFPEFVFLGAAVLLYQGSGGLPLRPVIWIAIILLGVLDTMGLHDAFALFRAQETLLRRVETTGVPRTRLDGGAQFNGWTQITETGTMNDERIRRPAGGYRPQAKVPATDRCRTQHLELTPSVRASYVVSFDPAACRGRSPYFETFHTWYSPHTRTLYAVKGPHPVAGE